MITSQSWFELSRIFSRSVFPTILEHGTGLFRLEGILNVMLDRKKNTTFYVAWGNRRHSRRHQQFLRKRLRNERRNSILMTRHYPDLGSASDWFKQISQAAHDQSEAPDPYLGSDASSVWNFCVVVTLRIAICFLRLHLSRTLCKRPLSGVSKSKCLPVFRSLPRRRSASGTGTLEEALRTTSAWETMSFVQK